MTDDTSLYEHCGINILVKQVGSEYGWILYSGDTKVRECDSTFTSEYEARLDARSCIDLIILPKSEQPQGDNPNDIISSIAISRADLMADIFTDILTRINKHGLDVDHIAVANLATVVYESMDLEES